MAVALICAAGVLICAFLSSNANSTKKARVYAIATLLFIAIGVINAIINGG